MTIDEALKNGTISLTDNITDAVKKLGLTNNGYHRWNDIQDNFIIQNASKYSIEALREAYINNFGIERSIGAIEARVKKLNCKTKSISKHSLNVNDFNDLKSYQLAITQGNIIIWTDEQIDFLKSQVRSNPTQIKSAFHNKFGTFRSDNAIETKLNEILESIKYTPKTFGGRNV